MFRGDANAAGAHALLANLDSFILDDAARQKLGGTCLEYHVIKQLPALPPATYEAEAPWSRGTPLRDCVKGLVLELTHTAWDLEPWAKNLGWDGLPFNWGERRRFLLRSELAAALLHLYGIGRDGTACLLDTVPIVRRKDEAAHGEHRTKRVILEIYDEMHREIESGHAYETRLDPAPADRRSDIPCGATLETEPER